MAPVGVGAAGVGLAAAARNFDDYQDAGDVIPGGQELSKVRVALKGRGKRGGGRVIYYWRVSESQILLVAVFSKNVRVDLTKSQLKALANTYVEK
jgi:hypothetical protein